MDVFML